MIGRNRYNTQLPPLNPGKPTGPSLFSKHYLLGIVFVAMAFLVAVFFIYEAQYGKSTEDDNDAQVCIQVVTPARNPETGYVHQFPTPCDVPEGWEEVLNTSGENTNFVEEEKDISSSVSHKTYEDYGFSFTPPSSYQAYNNFEYAYIRGQWSYRGMTISICYPPVGCQDRSGGISVIEKDVLNEVVDSYVARSYTQKDYDYKGIPGKLLEDERVGWRVLVFAHEGRTYHIEGYTDSTFAKLLDSFTLLD